MSEQRDNYQDFSRTLMLFDLALGGHHGAYIQHLAVYWYEHQPVDHLCVVVMPEFLKIHRDVVDFFEKCRSPKLRLIPIERTEAARLAANKTGASRLWRNLQEWQLFCDYTKRLSVTQALLMYLDTCEIPLTLGLKAACPFSGIYFRPTFHYGNFETKRPLLKEKIQRQRNKFTLNRILNHPQLEHFFCLDPFAVAQLAQAQRAERVIHLADPVSLQDAGDQSQTLREQLGVEPERQVCLLFGALDSRKGVYKLLEAIEQLPLEICKKLCLVLIGGTNSLEQAKIRSKVEEICQALPLQVVESYEFVSDHLVSAYFQMADLILALYQKHVGMSGILLLAAAAGKPVLSSDYGLMGELVRRYRLGLAVDASVAAEIANALALALTVSPADLGDRTRMRQFVEENSVEQYARTIFHQFANRGSSVAAVKSL